MGIAGQEIKAARAADIPAYLHKPADENVAAILVRPSAAVKEAASLRGRRLLGGLPQAPHGLRLDQDHAVTVAEQLVAEVLGPRPERGRGLDAIGIRPGITHEITWNSVPPPGSRWTCPPLETAALINFL
jgi:hypothetical protein